MPSPPPMLESLATLDDPLLVAARWLAAGRQVAVATVIATRGSSPRGIGSQLVVDEGGAMAGSVSGGCVEGSVAAQALKVLEDGEQRLIRYGIADDRAWALGLACGGQVEVYVEPVGPAPFKAQLLERLLAARGERRPVALVTDLITGLKTLVFTHAVHGGFGLEEPVLAEVRAMLAADRSGVIEPGEDGRLFVQACQPPRRLVVVGAVHVAQALVPMARLAGFEVIVVDPRRAFAAPERWPGVAILDAWPDEALAGLALDSRTAVVTLTHDPKLDDPALVAALNSPAFYVGALGSRATHARRLDRLRVEARLENEALARIHGPVGLAIGALTPAEIAVSVLADLIAASRTRG